MSKKYNSRLIELGFIVAENTKAMLAYWDVNLVCRFANSAYMEWFGVTTVELIDKMHIKQLLGPLYKLNLPYIKRALAGDLQVFERVIQSPGKEPRATLATYSPDIVDGQVKGFFVHVADISLLTQKEKISATPLGVPPHSEDIILEKIEDTLRSCLFSGFPGIPTLAKKHFISESKLKRDFKEKYNSTIFSFYRHLQMQVAEKYIVEKQWSKKQIAALLNFSNTYNFTNCYQKYLKEKDAKKTITAIIKASDENYRTFIAQAPFAIAMLDDKMRYMAASAKYIDYYNLKNIPFTGMDHFNIFPDAKEKWQPIYKASLNGETRNGEEFFELKGKSSYWLQWDVRPWYDAAQKIAGILIFTEDITVVKTKDIENKKILEILDHVNGVARIGTWKRNFKTGTGLWSRVTKEILEVPQDYRPDFKAGLGFYKQGKSRKAIKLAVKNALEKGLPFDLNDITMITAKGKEIQVRIIGYPEFKDGKCERLFGILQHLTPQTLVL